LAKLVNSFREMGFTRQEKLAVLYGSDPHHRARMFAFISNLRGWRVAAFGSFEEAMIWLSDDAKSAEVEPALGSGEQRVLLKVRDGGKPSSRPITKIRPKH
jgi:hypothetical protein